MTANKALIAHHGAVLANAAQDAGVALRYEAAVAGGIPIIKAVGEGLAANKMNLIYGIMNGTCNYILTQMESTGQSFEEVLTEGAAPGYAEADPTFDVDGIDTAHKLAILSSVAFGTETDFNSIYIEGIRRIEAVDIEYAREIGYRIKLLGLARLGSNGLEQRVHPAMVKLEEPIARLRMPLTPLWRRETSSTGTFYQGPRRRGRADRVPRWWRYHRYCPWPIMMRPSLCRHPNLVKAEPVPMDAHEGAYYIRLHVQERPGVIADITSVLKDRNVSLDVMLQKGHELDGSVYVILVTHVTREDVILGALEEIGNLSSVQRRAAGESELKICEIN